MKGDILSLINKIKTNNKKHKLWTLVVSLLSCIVFIITIYNLVKPAITYTFVSNQGETSSYKLTLIDTFQGENYAWKESYFETLSSNYALDLYFEDANGNLIKGKDIEIKVGTTVDSVHDKYHNQANRSLVCILYLFQIHLIR